MNVRWIKWSELLAEAGWLRNVDSTLQQIEGPEARRIAQAVNVAADYAWKFHPWDAACWVSWLLTTTSGQPVFEPGYNVLRTYAEDPLAAWEAEEDPKVLPFLSAQGTTKLNDEGQTLAADYDIYYLVRTAAPRFGGEARVSGTSYEAGSLIYDASTGDCWRCVRPHSDNQPPPTLAGWWKTGVSYTSGVYVHHGLAYTVAQAHTSDATNEPAYGVDWTDQWTSTPAYWAPQRLPHFLLTAVLAGARSWMESANTGAMQEAMIPALETEVSDFTITRGQRWQRGGSSTII